jgi:hypothetical protein
LLTREGLANENMVKVASVEVKGKGKHIPAGSGGM